MFIFQIYLVYDSCVVLCLGKHVVQYLKLTYLTNSTIDHTRKRTYITGLDWILSTGEIVRNKIKPRPDTYLNNTTHY